MCLQDHKTFIYVYGAHLIRLAQYIPQNCPETTSRAIP